ncbi:MAG: 16S rRNA (uracil(1498)-N(3))-methyltransferase, partial [Ferrovum sp. 37-45-19]
MPRFYSSVPIPASQLWQLPQTIFHHAVRVLRLKVGDEFTLFDGTGVEHSARLVAIEKHSAEVALLSQQLVNRESPLHLTLAQALIHHDKMDWVIQKAVELGVKEIMPIVTERSQVKLSQDKAQQRSERWQNIAISACEQSGRNH